MIIMINVRRLLLGTVVLNLSVASAAGQLAITEFMNNPDGADQGREWIELYNFGPVDLCLAGWTVEDQDTDLFALPDMTIGQRHARHRALVQWADWLCARGRRQRYAHLRTSSGLLRKATLPVLMNVN